MRKRFGAALGAGDQDLIKLRRVTWGSILNLALLVFAAYALIGAARRRRPRDVPRRRCATPSWWWLAFALVLAQLPRIPSAVSTMGSINRPLPLGPLTALQFAICYVNLAIPSTAARVAVNIRFFQRFGVDPATAVSAGVDRLACPGSSSRSSCSSRWCSSPTSSFDSSLDTGDLSGLVTICPDRHRRDRRRRRGRPRSFRPLRARLVAALAQGPPGARGAASRRPSCCSCSAATCSARCCSASRWPPASRRSACACR